MDPISRFNVDQQMVMLSRRAGYAVLALAAFFAWMCRYELKEEKSGNVVRLDRFTGEVATVSGSTLTIAAQSEPERKAPPTKARAWEKITVPDLGDIGVNVTTGWRDKMMLYRADVTPYGGKLKAAMEATYRTGRIVLLFEDSDGFELATEEISLKDVTRITDGKGGYVGIQKKGSTSLSLDSYNAIQHINVSWSGFD
ncbi:MAG: hypothetical protein JST11_19030 [Acidobacteria bacterium]|nr:hypothetical protein [Acidobacteriota bacterium]